MPYDANSIPFRRSVSHVIGNSSAPEVIDLELDTVLKAESILLEEYNYAILTAYQLKEGRAALFNIYLLIVGITASGLGTIASLYSSIHDIVGYYTSYATGSAEQQPLYGPPQGLLILAFIVLFICSFLSVGFFIRFIYMSKKYKECLISIEKIKDYYISRFSLTMPGFRNAFHWRRETIPPLGNIGSFMSLVGSLTTIIGCIYFEGFVILFMNYLLVPPLYTINNRGKIYILIAVIITSVLWLIFHFLYYHRKFLVKKNESRKITISS